MKLNIFPGPKNVDDKRVSANIRRQIQKEFKDAFIGIGCFEGNVHFAGKTRQ